MQDEQQYEQLILQYTQLKNGSGDIKKMIQNEDFDSALTMIKTREEIFLSCKCMRKYLELTPEQEQFLNKLLDELKNMEMENIRLLSKNMDVVKKELKKTQQTEKIHHAYDLTENQKGSIINIEE